MLITTTINELREAMAAADASKIGFIPTMGYLHQGHLSLVQQARQECDLVIASIFVNRTQFGPDEDLDVYPRDLGRDIESLQGVDTDLVFVPDDDEMYPADYQTTVSVGEITRPLEGARRPGHFNGVATIVAKLFNIVQPNRAYFGQKDAQQTIVIRQMVRDLAFPVEIIICPIIREEDGLAMSSRNAYLSPDERRAAAVLYRALSGAELSWRTGVRDADALRAILKSILVQEPLAQVDYLSVANNANLEEWASSIPDGETALLSMAVNIGHTRLIDNIELT